MALQRYLCTDPTYMIPDLDIGNVLKQMRGDWYKVADVDALLAQYREFIRYWSYCTRQGMLKYCPEAQNRLEESMRELCPEGLP